MSVHKNLKRRKGPEDLEELDTGKRKKESSHEYEDLVTMKFKKKEMEREYQAIEKAASSLDICVQEKLKAAAVLNITEKLEMETWYILYEHMKTKFERYLLESGILRMPKESGNLPHYHSIEGVKMRLLKE